MRKRNVILEVGTPLALPKDIYIFFAIFLALVVFFDIYIYAYENHLFVSTSWELKEVGSIDYTLVEGDMWLVQNFHNARNHAPLNNKDFIFLINKRLIWNMISRHFQRLMTPEQCVDRDIKVEFDGQPTCTIT